MERAYTLPVIFLVFASVAAQAQTGTQGQTQPPPKSPGQTTSPAPGKAPVRPRNEGQGKVIEEVVARVNNEIITFSDLEHARQQLPDEIRQECDKCTPEKINEETAQREKNLLRDLIDQSLLAQRGKDLGISVEPDVIKRLDQIRIQNSLPDLDALEKAIEGQGLSYEDFKNSIRNNLLTQEVIRREVQQDLMPDRADVQKYYDEHKDEFKRPDLVYLREIFVSTDGKTEAEIPDLQKKAETLLDRVKKGEDFGELAKHFSDGQTAKDGGELGGFERGQLDPAIEAGVFKLNRNDLTEVIRTRNGFMILQVEMRYEAGLQPLDKVENEVTQRLVMQQTEPALRKYLEKLREESYVTVKAGYTDTAAVATGATIEEVPPTPDAPEGKKGKGKGGKSLGKVIKGKNSGS